MGIPWGVTSYPVDWDRDEILEEWRPFAEAALNGRRSFNIMHGEDRIEFRRSRNADGAPEVVTAVTPDPAARARIDALAEGDGTYDLFDRIVDGYDVFVPWSSKQPLGTIDAPGRSRFIATLDLLMACANDIRWDARRPEPRYPSNPDLLRLADDLAASAYMAKKLKMLVAIHY